jgi:hypothetical protein
MQVWWLNRGLMGGVTVVLLAGLTPCLAGQDAGADKLPPAAKILAKSVEAQGGKELFAKIRTRITKADLSVTPPGAKGSLVSYMDVSGKLFDELELEGMGTSAAGTDGTTFWTTNAMMGPRLVEGEEAAALQREADVNALMNWREHYKSAKTVGTGDVDGRACYKVELVTNAGMKETFYFEQKRGLPLRVDGTVPSPGGDVPVVTRLSDYKPVRVGDAGEVLQAFTIEQDFTGMQKFVSKFTNMAFNEDLPDDRFALPDPVKALVAKQKEKQKADSDKP